MAKVKLWLVSAALALLVAGCQQTPQGATQASAQSMPRLVAVGYAPISTQPGNTDTERMLNAIRASKLDAYRELAEMVYGQRIDSHTEVDAWQVAQESTNGQVMGVIRGAQVIKTYAMDDIYVTELALTQSQF